MRRPFLRPLAAVAALALSLPLAPARAQRVIGGGDDAVTIPRGVLRIGIGGELTLQRDRWNYGVLEPLGASFSGPLGASRLAALGLVQDDVRALGVPDFAASLGTSRLDLRQRIFITPFSLEYGATEWLTIGVTAPLVRVRSEALQRLDGTAGLATVGLNPYFIGSAVPASNRATIDRFSAAAQALTARRDGCIANPGSAPECATILAEAAAVNALIGTTSAFASRLGTLYGGAGLATPSAYVPMSGSAAELALLARVVALRDAHTRYGVTAITPTTTLPLGAQTPLTSADLERLMRDSTSGYGAKPLDGSARINIGDVDVSAKIRLFDSFGGTQATRLGATGFGFRQSIGLTFRLGSGIAADPGDFLDLGTGSGENAIGVRSYTDVVFNQRLWTSIVVGWAQAEAGDLRVRIPGTPDQQLLESWREVTATVTRRPVYQVEIAPRYHLNDYLAIGGYYGIRHRSQDEFSYPAITAPWGATVPTTDPLTASREQRVGASISFSTLAAHDKGRVNRAFEMSLSHQQSISSSIGLTPKRWEDRLQFRYYTRLFGR